MAARTAVSAKREAEFTMDGSIAFEEEEERQWLPGPNSLFVDYDVVPAGRSSGVLRADRFLSAPQTPTPTAGDVKSWIAALAAVPATGKADVTVAADLTMRFANLAYARNDDKQAVGRIFTNKITKEDSIIELQLHSTGNIITSWFQQAHCVVYLYKLGRDGEGVGVVVSYKGSSSGSWGIGKSLFGNWTHNALFVPSTLFADSDATVHFGFRRYKELLDDRMRATMLTEQIRNLLTKWSGKTVGRMSFRDWLFDGTNYVWAAFTGHSLGSGMAQIAAADLAHGLATRSEDNKVFLATAGAPHAGGQAFVDFLWAHVTPHGGIHLENNYDPVTMVGMFSGKDPGRRVELRQALTVDPSAMHTEFTLVSTVGGWPELVTFSTPLLAITTTEDTYSADAPFMTIRYVSCKALDKDCSSWLLKDGP